MNEFAVKELRESLIHARDNLRSILVPSMSDDVIFKITGALNHIETSIHRLAQLAPKSREVRIQQALDNKAITDVVAMRLNHEQMPVIAVSRETRKSIAESIADMSARLPPCPLVFPTNESNKPDLTTIPPPTVDPGPRLDH